MKKIVCGVPAYGHQVDASQLSMWTELGAAIEANKTEFQFLGAGVVDECNLARARNQLMSFAIDMDADWLFTIDADTSVKNPWSLIDMFVVGAEQDAAVVAAPVRHRAVNAWNVQDVEQPMPMDAWRHKVVPVHAIGAAVMAISMSWIKKNWPTVSDPWFQFTHAQNNLWVGEDINFCAGVRNRGGTILCDGRIFTRHRERAGYLQ
jgi:hypothetical protein